MRDEERGVEESSRLGRGKIFMRGLWMGTFEIFVWSHLNGASVTSRGASRTHDWVKLLRHAELSCFSVIGQQTCPTCPSVSWVLLACVWWDKKRIPSGNVLPPMCTSPRLHFPSFRFDKGKFFFYFREYCAMPRHLFHSGPGLLSWPRFKVYFPLFVSLKQFQIYPILRTHTHTKCLCPSQASEHCNRCWRAKLMSMLEIDIYVPNERNLVT